MLRAARTVLLVDWASSEVPRTLAGAGYVVTSANLSRGTAASYAVYPSEADVPADLPDGSSVFPPGPDGGGYLVLRPRPEPPARADLVVAYRPTEEIPAIARHAIRLGAKGLWIEGGARSEEGRRIAEEAGLAYVDGTPIVDAVRALGPGS